MDEATEANSLKVRAWNSVWQVIAWIIPGYKHPTDYFLLVYPIKSLVTKYHSDL